MFAHSFLNVLTALSAYAFASLSAVAAAPFVSKESGTIAAEISPPSETERFTSPRAADSPLRVRAPLLLSIDVTPAALTEAFHLSMSSLVIPSMTSALAC